MVKLVNDTDGTPPSQRTLARARVPYEGKWVKATNVPIGEPFLLSEEEWGERTRRSMRKQLVRFWGGFLVAAYLFYLPVIILMGSRFWPDALVGATVLGVTFPLIMTLVMPLSYRTLRRKGLWNGLTENGLMMAALSTNLPMFVPCWLIEGAEVQPFNLVNRLRVLKLSIRGFKVPLSLDMAGVMGDDGMAALQYLMGRPPGPAREEPPELHVYGAKGVATSSIPRMPDDGE